MVGVSFYGTTKSVWLNKKREMGRALIEALFAALAQDAAAARPRACYFEWFAPEDMDRSDPATWRATLPALGHTVTEEIIAAELEKMDPAEFDRAYLNRTRKPTPPTDPNVPKGKWPGLVDAASKPVADSVALAIDVSQDRKRAAISAASLRPDGRVHLEVVAYRPGTDWVVPAVARLHKLWKPVAVAIAAHGAPHEFPHRRSDCGGHRRAQGQGASGPRRSGRDALRRHHRGVRADG